MYTLYEPAPRFWKSGEAPKAPVFRANCSGVVPWLTCARMEPLVRPKQVGSVLVALVVSVRSISREMAKE